jgi:DNA adenine methylase
MPATAPAALRPLLKWAGGKRWQVPVLAPLWDRHRHRRLVEPFCGGLGVAMGLSPARALLNDSNPHLINFYSWVQRGLRIDLPMENERTLYDRHRRRFNRLVQGEGCRSSEAAALFYYLNRTGYNGLCRFNQRGGFNVPFGQYATIAYRRDFTSHQAALADWDFSSVDVSEVACQPGDFVYADPPYDVEFTQYAREGFTWTDQERTARLLAGHAGPVILVNQATPRIEALYRELGFDITFLTAPRRINCTGDRRPAREIMATKNV